MDHETLQALIEVYRVRASSDLLSVILDEAEGPDSQAAVLNMLRALSSESLAADGFAPVRRLACQFALNAEDFTLAERLARISDLPDDKMMRAKALHGLSRDQEAVVLYRQAISDDPAIRNRELERLLGIRHQASVGDPAAKVISLTNYSSRRESRTIDERRAPIPESFLDDFDEGAVTFGEIAGLDAIKAEIRRRIILPYMKPSLFERFKQQPGGNLLFYGPPGCGKTLICRATAGETDARFLTINPDDIVDRYPGEIEKRLRVFFDEARADTPAVLVFDDFEIFASNSLTNLGSTALVPALLSELDKRGRDNSGVLILACTNAPWLLNPAFLRSGRFHKTFFVPPPDVLARQKIFSQALKDIPGSDAVTLDRIVRKTAGFSCADLKAIVELACADTLTKVMGGMPNAILTTAALEETLIHFVPAATEWLRRARVQIKSRERDDSAWRLLSDVLS